MQISNRFRQNDTAATYPVSGHPTYGQPACGHPIDSGKHAPIDYSQFNSGSLRSNTIYLLVLWLSALSLGLTLTALCSQSTYARALPAAPANVIFVDHDATGPTHDGSSWATAYTTLQDALAAATVGSEIWVAAGIYYPDEGAGATADDIYATFQLKSGVALYGGFAGTEVSRDERNWETNQTVLSGDLTQNDPDTDSNGVVTVPTSMVSPNAYHVVTADNVDENAILDGFLLTAGYAYGSYVSPCGPVCGGGLYVDGGSPQLNHLAVRGNAASSHGGGVAIFNSTVSLQNSYIQGNRAGGDGGGIYHRSSSFAATNVVLSGNRSNNVGGAVTSYLATTPITLTNVTLNGNRATYNGGALGNRLSTVLLRNSILWGNEAINNPGIYNYNGGTLTAEFSLIQDAYPNGSWDSALGTDGGNNLAVDPRFTTPITPTAAPVLGGDLRLQALSPAADAGDATINPTAVDLDEQTRLQGATIDLGAYESGHTAILTVTKRVEPAIIEYGEPVTYTVVLTNSGDAFAYNTILTDPLPDDLDFTAWLQQPPGTVYTTTGTSWFTWVGTVQAASVNTYQFVATHTGGPDETLTNTVTYSHLTGNNSAEIPFQVLPLPTVTIAGATGGESSGSLTFPVSLSAASRKPVLISYQTSDVSAGVGEDYTAVSGTLTIPPGALSGTITVPVISDFVDEEAETFQLTLTAATDGRLGEAEALGTISDDDTAGTAVTPTFLEIDEPAEQATFTITLKSQPVAPVLITTNNSDTSECAVPANVTLDATNWQNGIGVTVQAVDDFVVDNIQSCIISLTTTSADPHYHNLTLSAVQVDVHSDDTAGISINPSSPAIGEANLTGFFTVTLTSEPTATVTIALTADDSTECSVVSNISLNAGNWRNGVPVQVTTIDDTIDDDNQLCTIRSTVTSVDLNYDGRAMAAVPVTVVDDDTAGVAFNTTTLTTNEPSGQTTFSLSLTSEPLSPVTIHFTSLDPGECVVPPSVTLDKTSWNVAVAVPVSAVDDRIDDAAQRCVVQTDVTSSDAKYSGLAAADVEVTVQDDGDTAGITLNTTTVTVSEPDTTAEILITLESEPVAPVTISLASQDATECTPTSSVVLDASNWQTGRNVTIAAVDDNDIDGAQSCTVTTTATSADTNYEGIAVADPIATVEDEDYADIIVDSPNVVVSEPNNNTIMVLKLTSIPTAPVTVALSSMDPTECNVVSSVTLDGTNWNNGVGASIFAVNDDMDDGDRTCNIRATVTSSDIHYDGLAVADFPTTVVDDDTAGTTVAATSLTISEPAGSAEFVIALTSEPTATVTIDLVSGDSTECSVPVTTTLDAGNWQTGVSVTATAVDDAVDDETQRCTVSMSTRSNDANYQAIAIADVDVSVEDNETAGVVVAPTALTISEPNITDTFTIRLTSEPTRTVTVKLSSSDPDECMAPVTVLLDGTSWEQGISVPVRAIDDRIDDGDQRCTLSTAVTSADGDYAGIAADDVAVTVQDDSDTAGVTVSPQVLTVSEPAETATFTVALTSEPVAAVSIELTASDSSECTLPSTISLDADNWEAGVTVTISAVDDDVDDGTQQCVVQTSVGSADTLYNNIAVADVQTTVLNEDTAGMVLSTTGLTLTEPSDTAVYTLSLTSEPVAPVTVALQSSDTSECRVTGPLLFDASNWRGLAVAVTAVDDHVMDGPQPCAVASTVSSSDPLYHSRILTDVHTTVFDEDVAGIVVTPTTLELDELDGTARFTIALTSEPTAPVVVALAGSDTTECTVPASVTVAPADWQNGQSVTVTAIDDFAADGDQRCTVETGNATSQDNNYQGMAVTDVTATVRDDDRVAVYFTPENPVVREPNGTTEVTVRLGSEPAAAVTLTFTAGAPDECGITATATLTPANWREGVRLMLTAVDDTVDDGAQQCTVTTAAVSDDPDYTGLVVDGLPVTVEDDEVVAMVATVQASTATAEIGDRITYTYQVTNTGDIPLTVTATDSLLGAVTFDQPTVAPQSSIQGQLTRTAQERDLPGPLAGSTAFTARTAQGSVITTTATTTVAVAANPQVRVEVVRLGPPFVAPGTVVTYQVTMTNTGHIPAKIVAIQGEATTPATEVMAQTGGDPAATVAGAALLAECRPPFTIGVGGIHQCEILWTATKGESDAVEFVVSVDAEGLLDFAGTSSDSDVVIVSGPTSAGALRIYLPVVNR